MGNEGGDVGGEGDGAYGVGFQFKGTVSAILSNPLCNCKVFNARYTTETVKPLYDNIMYNIFPLYDNIMYNIFPLYDNIMYNIFSLYDNIMYNIFSLYDNIMYNIFSLYDNKYNVQHILFI